MYSPCAVMEAMRPPLPNGRRPTSVSVSLDELRPRVGGEVGGHAAELLDRELLDAWMNSPP
jgi:hypothetical protein